MIGKCTSCGHIAELSAQSTGSGRQLCYNFIECNKRRQGIIDANAWVVLQCKGVWRYFLRESFSTNPHTKQMFFIGYEAVYEWENATSFEGEKALDLANIWGGIVVPKIHFHTDTKPGVKANEIAIAIRNSLQRSRRIGARPFQKWSDKLRK